MSLPILASILSLTAYTGLLILVFRSGWHNNPSRRLFALYLLDMALLQTGYLLISLADTAAQAGFWYLTLASIGAAQPVLYLFCIRRLLGLDRPSWFLQATILAWFLLVLAGITLYPRSIYRHIYQDDTGLFVPDFGPLAGVLSLFFVVFWGLAVWTLLYGYRTTRSFRQRMRLHYLLLSISFIGAGLLTNVLPALRGWPIDVLTQLAGALLLAYAIFRYQLLDIQLVFRKGLLYSILATILGTGYFLLIYLALHLFQSLDDSQIFYLALAVAVIAALLAQPLQDWVQSWIDRRFFRQKYDGVLMVQRLSQAVTAVLDLQQLTGMILDEVTRTMQIGWAAFFLQQAPESGLQRITHPDNTLPPQLDQNGLMSRWFSAHQAALSFHDLDPALAVAAATDPEFQALAAAGAELLIPLHTRSRLIGVLSLGPKRSGQGYSQADEQLLVTLANQTAVAIDNARLYAQTRHDAESQAMLLNEVNHRVKNNLAAIIGLLYAERRQARLRSSADYEAMLRDLIGRVQSLATVHTLLSAANWSTVPLNGLSGQVITLALQAIPEKSISVDISPSPVLVSPAQAGSLALIFNELATNSAKYAWPESWIGRINVQITSPAESIIFEYRDDGPGFPAGVLSLEQHNLGLYLIKNIVTQELRGQLSLANRGGAVVTITFPAERN